MTTTWYKLSRYGVIEEVSVVSETPKFITVQGTDWRGKVRQDRVSKTTEWHVYRETKRECYQWLLGLRKLDLTRAKAQVASATDSMVKVMAMAKEDGVDL